MTLVKYPIEQFFMRTLFVSSLLVCFMIQSNSGWAQSKITISAPDSLPFLAVWNNVAINQYPAYSITFREENGGKIPMHLSFPTRPDLAIQQTLTVKPQMAVVYEVSVVKGLHKLVPASENSYVFESLPPVPLPPSTPATDSTTQHTNDTFSSQALPSNDAYEQLKQAIAQQTFESRKLVLMTNYLQTEKLNVDQLRYLMAQLSLEDRKLELLRIALPSISDKSRLAEVTDEFLLDKNKEKARELLAQ